MTRPQTFGIDDLAGAGLSVVQHEGWSAVSFRSVAEQLDVSPMALYRLAPDGQQLRRIIADGAAERIRPDVDGRDLVEVLEAWARHTYRHLRRYRGLPAYVITTWTELPRWLDIVEALLRAPTPTALADRKRSPP